MTDLARTYTAQYARFWRLLREHGPGGAGDLNSKGYDVLLDLANLRERDIETLRKGEPLRGAA